LSKHYTISTFKFSYKILTKRFPPRAQVAIEPKTKADLDKMGNGLYKLAQEDPSFHFQRDEETNQTVIEVSEAATQHSAAIGARAEACGHACIVTTVLRRSCTIASILRAYLAS